MFNIVLRKYYLSIIILILSLILSIPLHDKSIIIFICLLILLNLIGLLITKYRTKKGYYGTNEYEFREFIAELLKTK